MGLDVDVDPTAGQTEEAVDTAAVGTDIEETTEAAVGHMEKNSGSTSLQKEAARSGRTSTTATATGMKKIEGEDEEEEEQEILGTKTRIWRKINLSFAIELGGEDGDDIRAPDQKEGNNDNKMKHHPIMSKIAKFMLAVEKKCDTVKIMS
jgi:hypothetical protein